MISNPPPLIRNLTSVRIVWNTHSRPLRPRIRIRIRIWRICGRMGFWAFFDLFPTHPSPPLYSYKAGIRYWSPLYSPFWHLALHMMTFHDNPIGVLCFRPDITKINEHFENHTLENRELAQPSRDQAGYYNGTESISNRKNEIITDMIAESQVIKSINPTPSIHHPISNPNRSHHPENKERKN